MSGVTIFKFLHIICLIILYNVQLLNCFNTGATDLRSSNYKIFGNEGMPQITISGEYKKLKPQIPDRDDVNTDDDGRQRKIKDPKEWVEFNVTYSTERANTILSFPDERYTINCTAPYMTKWTTTIVPRSPATYGHADRLDHNPFQLGKAENIFKSQIIFMMPNGTSGFIQCESITDTSKATKVFIFAQGGDPFVRVSQKDEFQPPIIQDTRNNFYIPCVANYPDVNAILTQLIKYHDTTFESECSQLPTVRNYSHLPYRVVPKSKVIITNKYFMIFNPDYFGAYLEMHPSIFSFLLSLNIRTNKRIYFRQLRPNPSYTQEQVNLNDSKIIGKYDPQAGFLIKMNNDEKQRYRCRVIPSPGKKVTAVQRVGFDFYNPELNPANKLIPFRFHIGSADDEFPFGISCTTGNGTFNQIKMITCNSQYECDWVNDCFYDKCAGNKIQRKAAIPDQRDKTNAKEHGTIVNPFTRGKVICVSLTKPGVAYEYFFLGLDRHRYWLTSQASKIPKGAVIYMPETSAVLHTNKPAVFACETLNFVLLSNIKFAVLFKNGSQFLLDKINTTVDPAIIVDNDVGFSRKEIVTNLTSDMIGIMCLAPWLNSSTWVNTSRTFEARDVHPPSIKRLLNYTNQITFYEGDKTRSILCNATGEPQPNIQWMISEELRSEFEWYKLDGATLYFPVITQHLQGQYTCIASNIYGFDSLVFDVAVKPPNTPLGTPAIVGIVVAFVVLTTGLAVVIKKYVDAKKQVRDLTPEEVKEFLFGDSEFDSNVNTYGATVSEDRIQRMAFNPKFEIPPTDLSFEESVVLGEGHSGEVVQGRYRGKDVAVKKTKPNAAVEYFLALLSELKIMAYIGVDKHPNVVEFLGAVVSEIERRKVFVVVELSPLGDLQSFLVSLAAGGYLDLMNKEGELSAQGRTIEQIKTGISILTFVSWCEQIASGMEFLASKRVIHGDLAARNILVFHDGVVKITDFGLSKKLYQSSLYKKKNKVALPMAWMATESLRFMQFSTQSDVWSFAVTAWEIFSFGEFPYAGIPENDFVKKLLNGMRLEKPFHATREIYAILRSCWEQEPTERPSFFTLKNIFGDILKNLTCTFEQQATSQHQDDCTSRVKGVTVTSYVTVGAVEYVDM